MHVQHDPIVYCQVLGNTTKTVILQTLLAIPRKAHVCFVWQNRRSAVKLRPRSFTAVKLRPRSFTVPTPLVSNELQCGHCGVRCDSRNLLFKHLYQCHDDDGEGLELQRQTKESVGGGNEDMQKKHIQRGTGQQAACKT